MKLKVRKGTEKKLLTYKIAKNKNVWGNWRDKVRNLEKLWKILLFCGKGEYKQRKEDEVGENLLVIHLNNVHDLQTASCLIHSSK